MEVKLIELVRQNQLLYDKSKREYRNEDLKSKAWINIAKELKQNVLHVRKRWKTLRDKFTRERKRKTTTTGSAASSPKRQWKFYSNMEFLMDVPCTNNRATSNFTDDGKLSAGQYFENYSPQVEIDEDSSLLYDEPQESTSSICTTNTTPERNVPFHRKIRTLQSEVLLQNAHHQMSALLKDARQALEGASMSSPVQLSFLGLAKEIEASGMTFAQRADLQMKVMALVYNEINNSNAKD